jgi:hypothetical protein
MPSSNARPPRQPAAPATPGQWFAAHATAALTGLVTVVLALLIVFVRVDTRNAEGVHRHRRIISVWRATLDHLPSAAPAFLGRDVLVVLLALALIAFAYVLVATARLPRE